jgi:hypothetical protein
LEEAVDLSSDRLLNDDDDAKETGHALAGALFGENEACHRNLREHPVSEPIYELVTFRKDGKNASRSDVTFGEYNIKMDS